jgi:hypothetical protein
LNGGVKVIQGKALIAESHISGQSEQPALHLLQKLLVNLRGSALSLGSCILVKCS